MHLPVKRLLHGAQPSSHGLLVPRCKTRACTSLRARKDGDNRVNSQLNTQLLLASVAASITAASGALGLEYGGSQQLPWQALAEQTVQEASKPEEDGSSNSQFTARSSRPFDLALSSIINIADTLSLATGEFLDLTTGAASAAETGDALASGQAASQAWQDSRQTNNSAAVQLLVQVAASSSHPAAYSRDDVLVQSAIPSQRAMGVAYRMSQQALAVSTEALKLASLLDSQDADPSYRALLQQIEEAAHAVAAVAADIAKPGEWVEDEGPQGVSAAAGSAGAEQASDVVGSAASAVKGRAAMSVMVNAPALLGGL